MSRFLSKTVAEQACRMVEATIQLLYQQKIINRPHLAIVVIDPAPKRAEDIFLHAHNIGEEKEWVWEYRKFAREKALLTYNDPQRRSAREIQLMAPHLLGHGDTTLYGSVCLNDIVVGVSGVQPYFDEMFAYWVAAACQALALRDHLAHRTKYPEADNY